MGELLASVQLSHARLREILHYDQGTGKFTWLVHKGARATKGSEAGSKMANGYIAIRVDRHNVLAHRLAVFWMTGHWPAHQVDHRDLKRDNNAWENLRIATNLQNKKNTGLRKNNTSGFKGVMWAAWAKRFRAQITADRKVISLGYFATAEAAHAAYKAASLKYHGEFGRSQ